MNRVLWFIGGTLPMSLFFCLGIYIIKKSIAKYGFVLPKYFPLYAFLVFWLIAFFSGFTGGREALTVFSNISTYTLIGSAIVWVITRIC